MLLPSNFKKLTLHSVYYLAFAQRKYLVSITINERNAWAADNLAPLDMLFLFIIISLISPKITLTLCLALFSSILC